MKLKNLVIVLGLIFWPLSLILTNTFSDLLSYVVPALLLFLSFLLYKNNFKFYIIPALTIPLFEPKLALFPFFFTLMNLLFRRVTENYIFAIFALIILAFSFNKFIGQTIFIPDYEAQQKVVRDTQLYDSIFIARLFHNKARVVFDKFTFNLFALTDPNNYFFGFHPRQIATNQNLTKFPFLGIIFMLYGGYYLTKNKYKSFIVLSLVSAIIALSTLTIFDRNDFVLFVPLALILIHGVSEFFKKFEHTKLIFLIFMAFAVVELIRVIAI